MTNIKFENLQPKADPPPAENSKQILSPKFKFSKPRFRIWKIEILDLFKISILGFSILFISLISSQVAWSNDLTNEISKIESANLAWFDISADFKQSTHVELLDKTINRTGTLKLKKGGKLFIAYDGKDGKNYMSDGSTIWIFTPGDQTSLQTYAVDKQTMPKEALSFLSGFGKLRQEFKVTTSDEFKKGSGGASLHLDPKDNSAHFKSLDALFGSDGLLKELIINNTSGNKSHYTFFNVKTNQNYPDRLFSLSSGKATPDTLPR